MGVCGAKAYREAESEMPPSLQKPNVTTTRQQVEKTPTALRIETLRADESDELIMKPSKTDSPVFEKRKHPQLASLRTEIQRSGSFDRSLIAENLFQSEKYLRFENDVECILRQGPEGKLRNPRVAGLRRSITLQCKNTIPQKSHIVPDISEGGSGSSSSASSINGDENFSDRSSELEIDSIENMFEFLQIVGEGAYGKVVRVRNKMNGKHYALKIMDKVALRKLGDVIYSQVEIEREVLTLFDHSFIVRLIYDFETETHVCLVMELLEGRDLKKEIIRHGSFSEELVRLWSAEIILALEHMHKNNVAYRDLKPNNIMVDSEGHVRIIDLGIAKKLGPKELCLDVYGGSGYKSPEMLKETGYRYSTDFWNLGVVIYYLLTGKHPYQKYDNRDNATKLGYKIKYPCKWSEECFDLVSNLLKIYPENRIGVRKGVEELKKHPFFSSIDWKRLRSKEITIPFDPKVKTFSPNMKPIFSTFDELLVYCRATNDEKIRFRAGHW